MIVDKDVNRDKQQHKIHLLRGQCQDLSELLIQYFLPFGLLVLFTGMFWIGDRSDYHKLFYIFTAAPVVFILICDLGKIIRVAFSNKIFLSFLVFSVYVAISLSWSGTNHEIFSLLKRPFYVILLFYAVWLVCVESRISIEKILKLSLVFSASSAILCLFFWFYHGHGLSTRFSGYGALYNPLLTSHVYGAFAALALALLFLEIKQQWLWLSLFIALFLVLVVTGSRTPLFSLFFVSLWMLLTNFNRRSMFLFFVIVAAIGALFLLYPEAVISRGFSYRPEIWQKSWCLIAENPWFGYGYDHPLRIALSVGEIVLSDPHNIELAVLYSGGIVGLALWLWLYGVAVNFSWRNRSEPFALVISAMLIFGFFAGLTEGKDFLSRPKEHWFLIWIPMALLAGSQGLIKNRNDENEKIIGGTKL